MSKPWTRSDLEDAPLSSLNKKHIGWVWLACLSLAVVKLWLTSGQTLAAIGNSGYDDLHFLIQAEDLHGGQWLGPYNQLTLIKGPFFPIWILLTRTVGVPLLLAAQILYAFACGLLVISLRPLLRRELAIFLMYAFLLFSPESNDALLTRPIREMITPALTMIVAASAIGIVLGQAGGTARQTLWALTLGIAFAASWLTREEQIVVLPFLGVLSLISVGSGWRQTHWVGLRKAAVPWLAAAAVWSIVVGCVAAINCFHYGLFAKTELDAPSFKAAYGALSRVKPAEFKPLVPVTKETRRRIARFSPAFAEIAGYIDGIPGAYWESFSESQQDDANQHEILGGWFVWALRDAVNAAGYYDDGAYPAAYYWQLAGEVNNACTQGLLVCYAPRATMLPVWHNTYALELIPSLWGKLEEVITFQFVNVHQSSSVGSPEDLAIFRRLTVDRLSPTGGTRSAVPVQGDARISALEYVLYIYRAVNPLLVLAAMMIYGYMTFRIVRDRTGAAGWAILTALLVLATARVALIAYMNVSTYRVPHGAYLAESYPPLLAFIGLAWCVGLDSLRNYKETPDSRPHPNASAGRLV